MLKVTKPFIIGRRTVHVKKLVIETLKIKDHRATACTIEENHVVTFEAKKRRILPCSKCGTRSPRHDRLPERSYDQVPICGIAAFPKYRLWRVRCPQCGIKREMLPWENGNAHLTQPLAVTLASWAILKINKLGQEIFWMI
jgi:hypothetical protein